AMKPSELGAKSFFSDIFSSFSNKGETGTFTGEPVRENLTAPPAGYQTPSPDQPYGLSPKGQNAKAMSVEDRAVGQKRCRRRRRRHERPAVQLHPVASGRCLASPPATMRACVVRGNTVLLKLLTTLAAFVFVASAAGTTAPAAASAPQISHFTLPNGLEVVV